MYGLDICFEKLNVESVIESLPGGCEILRSDEHMLRLRGSGISCQIGSRDEKALHLVKQKGTA